MTELVEIAHIRSDFSEKFGIPRQSGLIDTRAEIFFEEGFRDRNAVLGLQEFSHIWLLWGFSKRRKDPYRSFRDQVSFPPQSHRSVFGKTPGD